MTESTPIDLTLVEFDRDTFYWVTPDDLWKGPTNPDGNLHFARLEGFMDVAPYSPVWVLRRSDPPPAPAWQIPLAAAMGMLRQMILFRQACQEARSS